VLVFGDFGERTPKQARVAAAMAREHAARPFDLALQLGDNVYRCGPDPVRPGAEGCRFGADGNTVVAGYAPPDDPLFERNEAPLRALRTPAGEPLPTWLALGNHDLGAPEGCDAPGLTRDAWMVRRACLSVAHRTPTWNQPARHYVLDRGPVRFIVVDTDALVAPYGPFDADAEIAFVRQAAAGCGDRRCFLAGHHPPAQVSAVGPPGHRFQEAMARLLEAGGGRIAAFLGGHLHTLQHLERDGLDVLIAGSSARGKGDLFVHRWPDWAVRRFASTADGFGVLEAGEGGWRFRFVADDGRPLHCCVAAGRGPCRPVPCTP
jgi:hypothetical protein